MTSAAEDSLVPQLPELLAGEIQAIKSVLGSHLSDVDVVRALSVAGNNVSRAINVLLDMDLDRQCGSREESFSDEMPKREESVLGVEKDADVMFDKMPKREESVSGVEKDADMMSDKMPKREDCVMGVEKDPDMMSDKMPKREDCVMGVKKDADMVFDKVLKREEAVSGAEKDCLLVDRSCVEFGPLMVQVKEEMCEKDAELNELVCSMPLAVAKREECEKDAEMNEPVCSMPLTIVKREECDTCPQALDANLSGVGIKKEMLGSDRVEEKSLIEKPDYMETYEEWCIKNGYMKKDESERNSQKEIVSGTPSSCSVNKLILNPLPIRKIEPCDDELPALAKASFAPFFKSRPISAIKPGTINIQGVPVHTVPDEDELEKFPEERDWFLVGSTYITGLSTCRGKNKLEVGEIVSFSFPTIEKKKMLGRRFVSSKTAAAVSEIVRFSTKRSGEIGRLPQEWTRCVIPLVNSSKIKIQGRSVLLYSQLNLMQEIVLYISFYIHSSIFTAGDKSCYKLETPAHVDSTLHPLPTLFKLLKMKPLKKADFTPAELSSRKRLLNLEEDEDVDTNVVGLAKRRKGGETYLEQSNDEQAITESTLNKLVGAAEVYDLKEAEPPATLLSDLRPYQKQALYWMSELEKGINADKAEKTLHPCWSAYNIADKRASAVYVNVFSGEATTEFPSATKMARGGILADAMGLGKTVMTIALILAKPNGYLPGDQTSMMERGVRQMKQNSSVIKGGTLIVCPMALLGQWKDELETHSKPGTLSVFVHYGSDKTNDLKVISEHHVVLTTYGVLTSAYKTESGKNSIFHRIEWYRVVLDEAHTIKSFKSQGAQSAFALKSYCRWCLTGTPLQNHLEDIYSLLCFLHVEPWCNWAWWHKLIQKPYEEGDERGLKLVKAILRPLMLRRTKDTKDLDGRPILVLPPANVQIVECKQSEVERDFYDALFKRSKVRFDEFVAQGKVLHNYASILELLLRLRQCCNHPFLVMSRGDTHRYADLDKLARKFLDGSHSAVPSKAFVEDVVEGIRNGEVTECPICLESASDDPVLTPCAHRMCRECLLSSWWSSSGGPCPICRRPLNKADLITCPSENRFNVDVEKNWKASSKVTMLMEYLEKVCRSGEKSIVFSQWTAFLDLVEIPLKRKNIKFLRFDGKLSQKHREKVLKEFNDSNKLVLLMSLKAGGVGLNLTAASNVFLMDPWWNPAVEEQAIMRIHRIGQKRQVCVRRFIVKDTVEERMQQVQARKQRMIAGALTDDEVRTARLEELKMLFR